MNIKDKIAYYNTNRTH